MMIALLVVYFITYNYIHMYMCTWHLHRSGAEIVCGFTGNIEAKRLTQNSFSFSCSCSSCRAYSFILINTCANNAMYIKASAKK